MGLEHGALRGRLHFTASVMGIKSVVGIFRLYYSFRVDGERRIDCRYGTEIQWMGVECLCNDFVNSHGLVTSMNMLIA